MKRREMKAYQLKEGYEAEQYKKEDKTQG